MPAYVLATVIESGDGTARPNVSGDFACLMVDRAAGRAVVYVKDEMQPSATVLVSDTGRGALLGKVRGTGPNGGQRATINTWLTANGYTPAVLAGMTWEQALVAAASQVNPAVDLDTTLVV